MRFLQYTYAMTDPFLIYDAVYLSPHLDDVVLSCGGHIFQQTQAGKRVLIVTVTAGDPPTDLPPAALRLHALWNLGADAVARRRAEDIIACRRLGADHQHGEVQDCIYRRHPVTQAPLYHDVPLDLFGDWNPVEQPLLEELTTWFTQLPPARHIYAPLTVGHHVDHQLTRLAAERAFGWRLLYYADYPYTDWPGALDKVVGDPAQWEIQTVALTPAAIQARINAIAAYTSQISSLFGSVEALAARVQQAVAAWEGERYWRLRSGS